MTSVGAAGGIRLIFLFYHSKRKKNIYDLIWGLLIIEAPEGGQKREKLGGLEGAH